MSDETEIAVAGVPAGFLVSSGWVRSVKERRAMDAEGPVPWFTYSAIRYLSGIVRPNLRVLEYGAGNSTLWWAKRVSEVVSVEHDPVWAASLRNEGLPNVTVVERTMGEPLPFAHSEVLIKEFPWSDLYPHESSDPTRNYRAGLLDWGFHAYASVLLNYPRGYFDVVVVDGMARVLTSWLAARQLAPDGMIVFDNSDRDEYVEAYRFLERRGFARVDFHGFGPINPYEWCTSIFVRSFAPLAHQYE